MPADEPPFVPSRLTLGEKLGYAVGDAAANFVLQMRLAFLTNFYTDVYAIAPTYVAVLQFVSHIVDACNDLVMGSLADRTQTKWGKFRPWIFWSAIPLAAASYFVFAAPDFGPTGRLVYASVTLILMIIAYGANNVPYSALGGVISDDPDERQSVASWRMAFAMLAALFVLTFTLDMVKRFGGTDEIVGYRATMAVWSTLAVVCSFTAFFMTRERISARVAKHSPIGEDLIALIANRPWRILAIASLLIYVCLGIRGSMGIYYFKYVLKREDLFGEFNAIGMIAAIVGIFFSKSLTDLYGKRNTFCGGLILSSVLVSGFYFLPGNQTWLMRGPQFAFQVAFGATVPIMWGMVADVADYTEWQFGRRITALTFAGHALLLQDRPRDRCNFSRFSLVTDRL